MATFCDYPTLTRLTFYLAVGLLTLVLVISLIQKRDSPLSKIPGPRAAAWSRWWLVRSLVSGKAAEEFIELDLKYGPLIRTGPNNLLLSDLEASRKILAVGSKYTRGPWFDALRLDPSMANVISERDLKKHQQMRLVLGGGIAGKGVVGFEETMDEHLRQWIRIIDEKYTCTETRRVMFDMSRSVPLLAVDLISHLCLGEAFECVKHDSDQFQFLFSIRTGMIVQQFMSVFPEAKSLLHGLANISIFRNWMTLFPNPSHNEGIGRVMREIQSALQTRALDPSKEPSKHSMLDSFIERGLTQDQALSEVSVVLASNTDNASSAAQAIIFCIITNPPVYKQIQQEIHTALQSDQVTFPISHTAARALPYLQACISEGLRRFPPEMQLRERVVPPEGDILCGYTVPGGTYIGFNALAKQYSAIYGDDAEVFRPERWLTDDEERVKQMHSTLELLFSHGSSKCLGVGMAYMEISKIVFELFRNFEVVIADPERPWKRRSRGSFVQTDFLVRIERRKDLDVTLSL